MSVKTLSALFWSIAIIAGPKNLSAQEAPLATLLAAAEQSSGYGSLRANPHRLPWLDRTIAVDLRGVPLKDALDQVAVLTGIRLTYSGDVLPRSVVVTLHEREISAAGALLRLLADTDLDIVVAASRHAVVVRRAARPSLPGADNPAVSQEVVVTGVVTDEESGRPLSGASVSIEGTGRGVLTATDGRYSILGAPAGPRRIRVSAVGYAPSERAITLTPGQPVTADFSLQPQAIELEGVVAVGYGTVRKSDLTGSVASISEENFNKGVVTSVDQLIQARAPGVQITQSSSEPGGGVSIRIRGSSSINAGNEPLYVIDGLPINNSVPVTQNGAGYPASETPRNPLNSINPSDIAAIEILKDASATAIYGSRGANGVVLITTKRGSGGGIKIDYSTSLGSQEVARKVGLMNTAEYIQVMNDLERAKGRGPMFNEAQIRDIGAGTDWQDVLFRTGLVQDHDLALSGGSAATRYYTSFSYTDHKGVVVSSRFQRYTGRVNLEHTASDRFRFGVNLSTTRTDDDFVPSGELTVNELAGAINPMLNVPPTFKVRDENGRYVVPFTVSYDNPLAVALGYDALAATDRTLGNAFAEYTLLPGLSARLNVGADRQESRRDLYLSTATIRGAATGGIATIASGNLGNHLLEGTLSYNRELGGIHGINAVAGYTFEQFDHRSFHAVSQGFPSDVIGTHNLGSGSDLLDAVGSFTTRRRLQSYLGRVNYNLLDRYLVTASIRADGSSNFGEGNRYGVFPSFALAWKMSDEGFMAGFPVIETLKPRVSWGRTGNDDIGIGRALQTFAPQGFAVMGNQLATAIGPTRIANPRLKWETTDQINVGVDLGLFGGRLQAALDYFDKKTTDLLLNLPLPRSTGFNSITKNVGSIRNTGLEGMVELRNQFGDFEWDTRFTAATLSNEVLDLGPIPEIVFNSGGAQVLVRPGQSAFTYYGHVVEGIFQQGDDIAGSAQPTALPGYPRWKDVNGDRKIDALDRVPLGDPFPDLTIGFNNRLAYRGLDLSVFVEAVEGAHMLNWLIFDALYPNSFLRNRLAEPLVNRWTPQNPNTRWPSSIDDTKYGGGQINNLTVEDASFVRLKDVRLGYALPVWLLGVERVRSAGLFVAGQNLWLKTKYRGYDPDVNSKGRSSIRIDRNSYPAARTVSLGFNVGF